ncbi:MAG: amidohydrolase [Lentisphaeria bacterium]|nr:amidohydrolase [Lentisphaeria bacterium]
MEELKRAVFEAIDRRKEELIDLGEDIWKHPEPGYREFRTSALAQGKFRELGLPVRGNLALTGFRADLDTGKPGPVVALLGEMDSLIIPSHPDADPQTGAVHACGHNTHITALAGAAMGLCDAGAADALSGRIAFIGTPAEEGIETEFRTGLAEQGLIRYFSGKPELIRCGAFDDVDIAMMNHLGGTNAVNFNGYLQKRVVFRGKSCHAAHPQMGVNAMNAANLALHALGLLRDSWCGDSCVRVHGIITESGDSVNVVPGVVRMEYMIRAASLERLSELGRLFDRAVRGASLAAGTSAEIETMLGSSPMINSEPLCGVYERCITELIPDVTPGILNFHQAGCTDMGDVSCIVPAVHGGCPGSGGLCHGADYRIADRETAYIVSSKLLASMVIELLHGDAAAGRSIAREKLRKMPVPDYLAMRDSFSSRKTYPVEDL